MRTLDDAWNKIMDVQKDFFPRWNNLPEIYYGNAIAGEVGELCSLIKTRAGGGSRIKPRPTVTDVLEESSDIAIYLILLMSKLDVTPQEFLCHLEQKINAVRTRMHEGSKNGTTENHSR